MIRKTGITIRMKKSGGWLLAVLFCAGTSYGAGPAEKAAAPDSHLKVEAAATRKNYLPDDTIVLTVKVTNAGKKEKAIVVRRCPQSDNWSVDDPALENLEPECRGFAEMTQILKPGKSLSFHPAFLLKDKKVRGDLEFNVSFYTSALDHTEVTMANPVSIYIMEPPKGKKTDRN